MSREQPVEPAPDPADEVKCYGARFPGKPGFGAICVIDPKHAKDTAKSVADWIRRGASIELVTVEEARAGMLVYLDARKAAKPPVAPGLF